MCDRRGIPFLLLAGLMVAGCFGAGPSPRSRAQGAGHASPRKGRTCLDATSSGEGQELGLRFAWEEGLSIPKDPVDFSRQLQGTMRCIYHRLSTAFGLTLTHPLTLNVISHAKLREMAKIKAFTYFSGAIYLQGRDTVIIEGQNQVDRDLERILYHELSHALMDHAGTGDRLPSWLSEGVAELSARGSLGEGELNAEELSFLHQRLGLATGLPTGTTMSPPDYLHAFALVSFLKERHGADKLNTVIKEILEGQAPARVFLGIWGRDLDSLHRDFTGWIGERMDAWLKGPFRPNGS